MLVAFDTNILVYADFEPDYPKGLLSIRLFETLAKRGVLPIQVIGEFLNVGRRRWGYRWSEAWRQIEVYREVLKTVPTDLDVLASAAAFSARYQLQFWDSVVWQASAKGGASILLTEDMQHGFTADGMRAVNPFIAPDWPTLARDLGISG